VIQPVSPTRPDDRQVVNTLRDLGKPVRNGNAALAVLLEYALARHNRVRRRAHRGDRAAKRFGHRLAREFEQLRLRIEGVEMAGAAFQKEPDDRFGAWLMVRSLRGERVRNRWLVVDSRRKTVFREH